MIESQNLDTSNQIEAYFDRLPGGLVIWIFFLLEMVTFGMFFLGFAWSSRSESEVFIASQAHLHPGLGTINTIVLLTGSWMAARGVFASRSGQSIRPWFFGAGFSGLVFMGIKIYEYSHIFSQGISLSTNTFWFYYIFLTLLHNFHVLFGVYFMFYLGYTLRNVSSDDQESLVSIEASAVYWHLVDIIWVFLFPLIYFSH